MNIKLNYVFMQNGTTFYFLDLIDHSWIVGLNFGGTVLSQLNLINVKERTFSSLGPHQKNSIKFNLFWGREIQGRSNIWWQVLINGRPSQMVMMFGEFILNDDLFFKNFKNLEPKVL